MNDSSFFTYSTKLMAATDDAWRVIMARARAKEKAVRAVLDQKKNGIVMDASMHVLQKTNSTIIC